MDFRKQLLLSLKKSRFWHIVAYQAHEKSDVSGARTVIPRELIRQRTWWYDSRHGWKSTNPGQRFTINPSIWRCGSWVSDRAARRVPFRMSVQL